MSARLTVSWNAAGPAAADLAREEAMLAAAAAGQPILALATWPGPVVVLGYAQDAGDVRLDWCREHGIPVLRRITGGTGVIHRSDLGVSLALPASHLWAVDIGGLYDRFLTVLAAGLSAVGAAVERRADPVRPGRRRSPICFEDQSSDTLLVGGRKCVGCAQARRREAVLIHAAVLLGLDPELYGAVFGVDPERVAAGLAPAVTGVAARTVGEAVAAEIAAALGWAVGEAAPLEPSDEVLARWQQPRWAPVGEE